MRLVQRVAAHQRRADAVHDTLVGGGVGIVAFEIGELELFRRLGFYRMFVERRMTLLLEAAVIFRIGLIAVTETIVGRANQPAPIVGAWRRAIFIAAIRKRGRRREARAEIGIVVIAQLLRADRRDT